MTLDKTLSIIHCSLIIQTYRCCCHHSQTAVFSPLCSVLLGSTCLSYAPVMKPFVWLKSWNPVRSVVCSIILRQVIAVTYSRRAQQAASRVTLTLRYHHASQWGLQPCITRAASPQGKERPLCRTIDWPCTVYCFFECTIPRDVPNFGSGSGRSDIRPFMANPAPAILLAGFGQVPYNNIRAVPCCKQSIIVFPVYV